MRRRPYFWCENWWALKPGYKQVCKRAILKGGDDWVAVANSFKSEVRQWGGQSKSPDTMLAEVENEMSALLVQNQTDLTLQREKELQKEHQTILQPKNGSSTRELGFHG